MLPESIQSELEAIVRRSEFDFAKAARIINQKLSLDTGEITAEDARRAYVELRNVQKEESKKRMEERKQRREV